MANKAGTVFIAFNGEVYNAFDYRAELQAAGFQFRSGTDTEVLLYLYEHYGLQGMLDRANGMFAIVIVDLKSQVMHIVRDHLGIKPVLLGASREHAAVCFGDEVLSGSSTIPL